ncbi:hypothetical protein [Lentibacillus sp. Marseille-P4043]|uniref:hypothetical protein n=1 Tax=Lentibacillus sp. Marseille-P4043 TaxID=2040293 RepID=UPI0018F88D35|nr:hypothetical protein [Lentibacillus sp. Marseille-P4043]
MGEQEQYKMMLKKMIDQTENFKIQSSEELIQALVKELTRSTIVSENSIVK